LRDDDGLAIARGTGGPPVFSELDQERGHGRAARATASWFLSDLSAAGAAEQVHHNPSARQRVSRATDFTRRPRASQTTGIYLAAVVALIIFSPVIYWNWQHEWVSFKFQFSHGWLAKIAPM